ncbi:phosphotransferase family protein [Nocardia jiangxiensis]|uniref:phosphotransferase family protein n=1 Tax=Nocardia jiangxiensis TaxID=282685 RepID=UPI0002FAE300|nr:phosphotransferase family protein [Nocardia jiangxiensis]
MTDTAGSHDLLPGLSRAALTECVANQLNIDDFRLESVRVAGQGMSDDTLLVDGHDGEGNVHNAVVRRYKPNGLMREFSDPARQFATLTALADTPVPAPRPLWFDPDDTLLGGASIGMERVEGFTPVPWSPSGQEFLRKAGEGPLGRHFSRLLAQIHAVNLPSTTSATSDSRRYGRRPATLLIDKLQAVLDTSRSGPEPVLSDALGWLRANAPETDELVLVHGDYRTGNLMFSDDRIAGVLDWEFAQPGDPMQDVAWVLAASNRVGSDLACYMVAPEQFVADYEEFSGRSVSWPAVRFWQVYYQVFNAMCWVNASHLVQAGLSTDLRMLRWSYTLPTMRQLVSDALEEAK